MKTNDVIESYVAEVMRRLPAGQRNEIGLELRGLLTEMLADRGEATTGEEAVLAMLREFGTPEEVATRYRPPGMLIIRAEDSRSFAWQALGGVALQWALTLPRVFEGQPLSAWWLSWGLGALWWPGFMVMMALIAAWLRSSGLVKPKAWTPRVVDPERVERRTLAFGLAGQALGAALVASLPWLAALMPEHMAGVFAFDPAFLRERAAPVLLLWLGQFALYAHVLVQGRWSPLARRLEMASALAFLALLGWWLAAGDIFLAKASDDGAKAALGLVMLIIVVDLAVKFHRRPTRLHTPRIAR